MTTNLELANKVAKHVALDAITLRRAKIESNVDPLDVPPEVGMSQWYRCTYENHVSESRERVSVSIDFKFFAKRMEAGEEKEELITLEAAFLLIYSLPPGLELNEDCFKYFAEVNGPYNAWPYWRELVQTATGRVGLAGVTVPVFRPTKFDVTANCEGAKQG